MYRIGMDSAGENKRSAVAEFYRTGGSLLEYSHPYARKSNGGEDIIIQELWKMDIKMLMDPRLPHEIWREEI